MQGTLYYTLFKGKVDIELMNTVGFDAFELGNHEFDDGNVVLSKFLKLANFPILAANIDFSVSKDLKGLVKPYIIKIIGNERVGIIGLDTLKTLTSSSPGDDLIFHDEVETAQKIVRELEAQDVNKIILLAHYGYKQEQSLAKKVAGIDVILGGDSHTLLGDFKELGLHSQGPYPTKVTSPRNEPTCIAHAWQYSYIVGSLRIEFDDNGVVSECSGNPILLVGKHFRTANRNQKSFDTDTQTKIRTIIASNPNIDIVEDDPVIAIQLAKYSAKVKILAKTVIGQAGDNLLHTRIPGTHESGVNLPTGSQIAPLVAEGYLQQLNSRNYGVDLVIQNAGAIRVSVVPKGDITIETAYTLLPFNNTIQVLQMTGAEIKQVLEDALSHHLDKGGSNGSFPYAAGIRYTIEVNRSPNQRVTSLEIRDKNGAWSAIDVENAKKMYKVGTNSYIAKGKNGYVTFGKVLKQRGFVDTYFSYTESFVNYIKKVGKLVMPKATGVIYVAE